MAELPELRTPTSSTYDTDAQGNPLPAGTFRTVGGHNVIHYDAGNATLDQVDATQNVAGSDADGDYLEFSTLPQLVRVYTGQPLVKYIKQPSGQEGEGRLETLGGVAPVLTDFQVNGNRCIWFFTDFRLAIDIGGAKIVLWKRIDTETAPRAWTLHFRTHQQFLDAGTALINEKYSHTSRSGDSGPPVEITTNLDVLGVVQGRREYRITDTWTGKVWSQATRTYTDDPIPADYPVIIR